MNQSNTESVAELRTIGLSDATSDSELSIRHLELTPNTSENSFRLSPNANCDSRDRSKHSKESIDSGCQNETHNSEHIRNDTWRHCDLNILDITKHNNSNRKMDTLELIGNNRKSSSSTLSDASSCGTNRSGTSSEQKKRKDSPKYHSVRRNYLRKDAIVSRSKSFQEQDVRKISNPRIYILRRRPQTDFDDFELSKTISHHNIEITIEDTDANEQPINHRTVQHCQSTPSNEFVSNNSSDLNFKRHKIRSGHILGRIIRRMRKLSMAWRKSKNKTRTRTRGDLKFNSFRLVSSNLNTPSVLIELITYFSNEIFT